SFAGGFTQVVQLVYLSLLGFDSISIGIIVSMSAIYPVRLVLYSIIADKYGKTRVLAFMHLTEAAFFATYYFNTSFAVFVLASLFTGGIMGGGIIEQALLAEKSSDEVRTAAFSTQSFINSIFSILGNSFSGITEILRTTYILDIASTIKPLFILGILISLAAMVMVLLIKEDKTSRTAETKKKNFILIKSRGLVLRFSISSIIMGVGQGVFFSLASLWFWLTYNVKLAELGYILAISKIVEAPTYLLAPAIAKKFGLVKAYLVTRLTGGLVFALMPLMPNPILAAIVFAGRNAIMHVGLPMKTSYMMALLSPEERASAVSIIELPSIVPNALASTLGGYLMEYVSTSLPVYIAVSAFSCEAIYHHLIFNNIKPPEERNNLAKSH
ncbi:MFS transporter, partial [Candidatus Bathyarchaeota archaeon]|nr:MFS transporter [Candidatus Bathyarchaeota archaeon]